MARAKTLELNYALAEINREDKVDISIEGIFANMDNFADATIVIDDTDRYLKVLATQLN